MNSLFYDACGQAGDSGLGPLSRRIVSAALTNKLQEQLKAYSTKKSRSKCPNGAANGAAIVVGRKNANYFWNLRRTAPAIPNRPEPSKSIEPGSGTGGTAFGVTFTIMSL